MSRCRGRSGRWRGGAWNSSEAGETRDVQIDSLAELYFLCTRGGQASPYEARTPALWLLSGFHHDAAESLGLERAAAAAGFGGVGVVEGEAAFFEAFVEIDCRAVEIEGAFLIDHEANA